MARRSVPTTSTCRLQIVRQFMARLIQLNVIRPRHDHHGNMSVFTLLDGASELRSFSSELIHGRLDVIAHQGDQMMTWMVVGSALPFAMRRVHAHLARTGFENEPILVEI